VVDDCENDILLLTLAFQRAGLRYSITAVRDGEEAIAYLEAGLSMPDLLLLDINMPRMTGFDVLTWLQGKPAFEKLPIVMHSSSNLAADMELANKLGATAYFVKAPDMQALVDVLDTRFLRKAET
jgi:CheY-like chemotaxis protein